MLLNVNSGVGHEKNIRPNNEFVIPACFWRESSFTGAFLDSRLRGNDVRRSMPPDAHLLPAA